MDFQWFKDLGNLSRTGNFSQAAEIGNISQPAFSRRIKALEAWVGVDLVDRSTHPVALTSAGRQMLEAGEQALARVETERSQIRDAHALPDQYVVTFGAQHSIGWRFYPAWLQAFEAAFGPIMSRLRADDLPSCLKDLQSGQIDFVIAYDSAYARTADRLPSLQSVLIGEDTLLPVCKCTPSGEPMFALSSNGPISAPYLRFGEGAPISAHIEPLLAEHGLLSNLTVVYENSMAGALRIRAREGAGIAWLPKTLVAPDLEAGLLIQIGDAGWETKLEIRLHRLVQHANPLTRKIWSFLNIREQVPLLAGAQNRP
ncbi:MAG: LysR family transcriptional regulator [Pseudomonadota bacterium]